MLHGGKIQQVNDDFFLQSSRRRGSRAFHQQMTDDIRPD
jgi:hypothetical protein